MQCIIGCYYYGYATIDVYSKSYVQYPLSYNRRYFQYHWMSPIRLFLMCGCFKFVECLIGGSMALYINDSHILYYHMNVFRLAILECSYFISPDYMVQGWIRAILLSRNNTILVGLSIPTYIKFFPGVIRDFCSDADIVPSHHHVAALDVTNHFIVIAFPIPWF